MVELGEEIWAHTAAARNATAAIDLKNILTRGFSWENLLEDDSGGLIVTLRLNQCFSKRK